MRLIELSANHDSFKTVRFNRSGLTLVVGSRSKVGETYNGVGKSLLIELVHFCLGAKANPSLEENIPAWEFTLQIELRGELHSISRNTSSQEFVFLNNEKTKVSALNKWLEDRTFLVPPDVKRLSFRSLISKFIRRGNAEYNDPLDSGDYGDYDKLLRNAFLLGIDVYLIATKHTLREEITRIRALRKNFKEDPLLKEFYSGGKAIDLQLSFVEQRIRDLERERDRFAVAENYYDMQKAADKVAIEVSDLQNSIYLTRMAVENIDRSMQVQPDLDADKLMRLYGELENIFLPNALRRLHEVSEFHKRLLANRIARLTREKHALMEKLANFEAILKERHADLDQRWKTLGESRALDQYNALVSEIATLNAQARKFKDYIAIDKEYSNSEAKLKLQLGQEVIKTNEYLEAIHEVWRSRVDVFKSYVAKFYPSKLCGISLSNNEGENQLRFDLNVHIENDSSDGINEVRIFCYDLTLLTLAQNHRMQFVFHDSRLFANMDTRQRATVFKLAHEISTSQDLQYIATLNPDQIEGMEIDLTEDELEKIIRKNIVLELKDSSAKEKLLGIQVDMHYTGK